MTSGAPIDSVPSISVDSEMSSSAGEDSSVASNNANGYLDVNKLKKVLSLY